MIREEQIEHLVRRAGFGASQSELEFYVQIGPFRTLQRLLDFDEIPDTVDQKIGQPGYAGITARGEFLPNSVIRDSRQRWLFRMVHTERPLQEKMALFWHNHFATAYSKIAGIYGADFATRMMAAKPTEDGAQTKGQLELFREYALGNFRDLLIQVAQDPAMLTWLDGRLNVRGTPQENFARELNELFTMGVGNYTEEDIYAGAKVFTGWNLRLVGDRATNAARYEFFYNPNAHDTSAKAFSFPIYPDGSRTIQSRAAASGMQDGLDLVNAVARHPETARRLARKLYSFFISEISQPSQNFVDRIAGVYFSSNYEMKPVVRAVLTSPEFNDPSCYFARYSWPSEFVARAIKEVGWTGYSVDSAINPLANMGQQLFEPPDVNGWALGKEWFSTGGTLARMNFAASLTQNQKFALRDETRGYGRSALTLLSYMTDRLTARRYDSGSYGELMGYLQAGRQWTGADADLAIKVSGVAHLILASAEYQLI